MRILDAILAAGLVLVVCTGCAQTPEEKVPVPLMEIENPTYNFGEVMQGGVVKHDFQLFNRGTVPLEIKKVKPD